MMTKIGQWFHWVIFRLSVIPIIWLVALVIGPPLSLLLLKDTNVINQSSDSLALTFTGLIVGVLLANITQVIHEVISHHFRYPPSIPPSSSHQGGLMTGNDETENQVDTNTDPNKEVRDRCTTGWERYAFIAIPLFLLAVGLPFLGYLALCDVRYARTTLVLVLGFMVAVATIALFTYAVSAFPVRRSNR